MVCLDTRLIRELTHARPFVLPQPEVDYIALYGDLYMMPREDGILLGGTHERGNWSLEPDMEAFERIVAGHRKLFAGMA